MKKIFKLVRDKDGQSLVEFALVMPLLLALILGMVEFGWILNGKITLTSAAREGARTAVIYETAAAAATPVQNAVANSTASSSLTGVTATISTFDVNTRKAVVTVKAKITPIIRLYVPNDMNLTARAEMRIE